MLNLQMVERAKLISIKYFRNGVQWFTKNIQLKFFYAPKSELESSTVEPDFDSRVLKYST